VGITEKEISQGFKLWKEVTSTPPSNRHLGHYVSLLRPDGRKDDDFSELMGAKTMTLLSTWQVMGTYHQMMGLCTKLGILLVCWQEIVMTMPAKTSSTTSSSSHSSRSQPLDKNSHHRQFLWHGEMYGIFGEAQAGSQPGHSAINVVLQKELTYEDISQCSMINLAMMENDARACFDWMIPSMVMLAL
jgi:hypothetical protein